MLAAHVQKLPAGSQDAESAAGREQPLAKSADGVHEVLAVVQDQQQMAVP
jgi:hypothetical protein